MNNPSPIVINNGRAFTIEETFSFLEECGKFEKSTEPFVARFCDYLAKSGSDKKIIEKHKLACENFIGFLSLKCGIRNLLDVTKAQVGSKYLRFENKGVEMVIDRWGRRIGYEYDNRPVLKKFFLYLHQFESITNKKVLRALCSKSELKSTKLLRDET